MTDGDAISRQAVLASIDAERKHLLELKMDGAEHIVVHHARRIIEDMPSVNPQEPKTGHWIEEINDYGEITGWHCDKCYEDSGFTTECKWDFCPNCGTKMEVEHETD